MFLRIAGAHCAEQFGIIGVKRPFDPNKMIYCKEKRGGKGEKNIYTGSDFSDECWFLRENREYGG